MFWNWKKKEEYVEEEVVIIEAHEKSSVELRTRSIIICTHVKGKDYDLYCSTFKDLTCLEFEHERGLLTLTLLRDDGLKNINLYFMPSREDHWYNQQGEFRYLLTKEKIEKLHLDLTNSLHYFK